MPRKTFRYGATERHNVSRDDQDHPPTTHSTPQLDVYYPEASSGGSVPILFFVYGGGFDTGTRQFDPPLDLIYTNTGAFFAKRG